MRYAHAAAPEVPVIVDAKRGDIGTTNDGYARFLFDVVGADAITVHPYLGAEAAGALLGLPEKGVYVLCRTSNPGARELQDLQVCLRRRASSAVRGGRTQRRPAVEREAELRTRRRGDLPPKLAGIRTLVPDPPLLLPGGGAQGADVQDTVMALGTRHGAPVLINNSRGIIFAGDGPRLPTEGPGSDRSAGRRRSPCPSWLNPPPGAAGHASGHMTVGERRF